MPGISCARWRLDQSGSLRTGNALDLATAAQSILALFSGLILPFDGPAAREFATIVTDRRRAGRPIQDFDAQIAAITRSRGMSLATRDVHDFANTGVPVIDPWQP